VIAMVIVILGGTDIGDIRIRKPTNMTATRSKITSAEAVVP
jgi:hypothetical protein